MKLYESFLYQLEVWQELESAMDAGEDLPELVVKLSNKLDSLTGDHDVKALNIARIIKGCKAEDEALKREIGVLSKRMKANASTAGYLTKYLSDFCEPGVKIEDATAKIGWRKSEVCEITIPEDELPIEFIETVQVTKVLKQKIKDHIKASDRDVIRCNGNVFAMLVKKQSIQIK